MCTRRFAGGRALRVLALAAALAALFIFVPAASAQLEDPWFAGNLAIDWVDGGGFTPYATVTVVIKDAPGGTVLYEGSATVNGFGWFEATPGVDLVPGMYISVSEGPVTKELTLAELSIDVISPAENTVTGTAPPSATFSVSAEVGDEWPSIEVTSDSNGDWTADFDEIGVDITPYTYVGASIGDEDGDQTDFDLRLMELPAFEIHRDAERTLVYFQWWTAGETLVLTIEDPTTPASPDFTTSIVAEEYPVGGDGFGRWVDYVVKPGDAVTVTDGTTTKSHTVTAVAVTSVDQAADAVRGTASPGTEVSLWNEVAEFSTLAAGDGTWVVDLSGVLDIVPGTWGIAAQADEDGDSTNVGWQVPRPEGWQHNPATGHDYLFVEDGMSWADAEAYAVSLGGHLVSINDAAEDEWLVATFGAQYWIGLNDIAVEGEWVWTSGEPVTYTNWFPGEPNNSDGTEDAAKIENWPPVGWNDLTPGAADLDAFVVEVVDATPPTTIATGYDDLWHNQPVTVTLSANDEPGGSGVAQTEYRVDGGSWRPGTEVTIATDPEGWNDGAHTVDYRSVDNAGNVEEAKSCTVKIDTQGDTSGLFQTRTRRGTAFLWYTVYENLPAGSPMADVTIEVKSLSGQVVATLPQGLRPVGAGLAATLPKGLVGTYLFTAYATDQAGNPPFYPATRRFTIYR